jgi:hypothetical protein
MIPHRSHVEGQQVIDGLTPHDDPRLAVATATTGGRGVWLYWLDSARQ